jgi:hypothetical protein
MRPAARHPKALADAEAAMAAPFSSHCELRACQSPRVAAHNHLSGQAAWIVHIIECAEELARVDTACIPRAA